ncbi:MAG: glycosyltransferase family 2 protein [Lachnospiraceae bacterium]|nr:glycosyltransferase family 2 protein [Lachnospiraceae bacterium]
MEKKKITVLMSTYNGEKYLRDQLDSILGQTVRDILELKLLVRDDGSTDSTIDILREYKEKYKDTVDFYQGENLRSEKSFWHLVKNAETSDYYAFSDQDDVWMKDKLKRAVLRLEKMQDIPKLYCSGFTTVDADLNIMKTVPDSLNLFTDFPHALMYSTAPGCTFVFNHKLRMELVKYDMDANYVEYHDWLTHKIAAMKGKVYYDRRPSIYYRQHGGNVVGSKNGGLEGFIRRVMTFLSNSHGPVRSECARSLLNVYGKELPPQKRMILKEVALYRENRYYKNKFIGDRRFYPGGINTVFHVFLILVGRI